ncbi:efflux RND transporter permease subunit [Rhizobium sp. WW_1]|jgi:HAE1 family hydrophobic/amphiphilic exporter-1|uniref:efflux RND transporter permease subunit n=1 Tax=Rhizobium sp. WW_1 TaxID=1907375 RepID=UPI00064598E3|nr:efflux RND transporter permease subunit [Rhizobium sp. WW_1]RKD67786.1 hydrophobe/amphiphile efflux-1 (HAE1) family protein [Rhizobium sp. WW_1]
MAQFSGPSAPFIKHPIATSLIMAGILLIGIVAYPLLPVAPLPQVDFPTIQVSVQLPGASPTIMASSVAQPLETAFASIAGVSEMTSLNSLGSTQITLQFDLDRDIDGAANDVQAAINSASGQLPTNLPNPPTYRKVNPADSPILLLSATSDTLPLTTVDNEVETKLGQQISQLPGVAQVLYGGQQKPAIRVQLDPSKMAVRGLTLEDVRTQLNGVTENNPTGNIDGPTRSYTIYTNGQLTEASKWNDVIVTYQNGSPLYIRDIGQAVSAAQDSKQAAWANGKRGIFLIIFKQPGANVIQTVDSITAELPRLTASMQPGIKVGILSDRTQTIRAAVSDVRTTLLITVLLVIGVIFVFLRSVRATIIPSLTVPLALFGACAMMWIAGFTLDNLSLMALTIAVGFVVDDAIVVLENIQRHIDEGMSGFEAAMTGAGEIGFTILSISLSLVAVLLPLLLMSGIIGRLFREFSVTLAMTIAVSAFVSLTLIPMLASRFLRNHGETRHGRLYALSERGFDAMTNGYEWALDLALKFRLITLAVFFASLVLSVLLFIWIPKGFFPQQDTGLITGQSEAAQDISFAKMLDRERQLGAIVQADPDVASVAMAVGGVGNPLNTGRMFITLKPRDQRQASADEIIRRLQPKLQKVEGARLFLQAAQDVRVGARASRTQYQMSMTSADIDALDSWSPKVLAKMQTLPGLEGVASDQQTNGSTLTLTIDRAQAQRYGIQPEAIDNTLDDAFGQRQIAQYFTQLSSYDVIMEVLPSLQSDVSTLDKLYVKASDGSDVPLSVLAHWTTVPVQPLQISHESQFPSVTISFNLAAGTSIGVAADRINAALHQMNLPTSINTSFEGTAQAFQQSLSSVPLLLLGALVVVYLILGVLYESYIHPLTILSTLPSAGVGAMATLMLLGYDFSLIALIAVILLIGIVKKNGIMMVDFAIEGERNQGLTSEQAIRKAALIRFRPIMMTTMATMLGAVPLMLGHGTGSELRQPLGFAMFGGLAVSQALTLLTTPVVYLYLDGFSNWLTKNRENSPKEEARREQLKALH